MSTYYDFDFLIEAEFNEENLKIILNNCDNLDFVYCLGRFDEILSADNAINFFMNVEENEPSCISLKMHDIIVDFAIQKEANKTLIIGFGFGSLFWVKHEKDSRTKYILDVERYFRKLMLICNGFKIINASFQYQ